jgi:hypothetical protein
MLLRTLEACRSRRRWVNDAIRWSLVDVPKGSTMQLGEVACQGSSVPWESVASR